nr:retrotransposon protein, putative, Ty1-copia subclass [Tanacetum cinerariifolium]
MAIQGGKIQNSNKKLRKAKGKGKRKGKGKDKSYIFKPKTLHLLLKSTRQRMTPATTARSNGIYEIDMSNLVPNVNSIYNVSNKRVKHNLDSTYIWYFRLAHISKKHIEMLQHDGLLKSTDEESFDQCDSCLSGKMTRKSFPHRPKRATDLLVLIHIDVCGPLRHVSRQDYALESATRILSMVPTNEIRLINFNKDFTMGYYFYFPPENKIVVARYAEFVEKNLIFQEVSGRAVELEEIQDVDTSPSEITSKFLWRLKVSNHLKRKVDYEETFSSIADIRAIRILKAIAAFYDYEIWKIDVKTAFLNGYLDEEIYMVQPKGFVDPKHPKKVCKLQISIYGLKQASRSWNKRFDEEIKKFGFTQNLDEPCVYQKASGSNVTFLILYVDDIIIMKNHIPSLQSVKDYLRRCFGMKDLGGAAFILGIKIYRDRSKRLIGRSQSAYMDKILKRYRMDNSKRGYIPMQEKLDLNKTQGASIPEEVKRMQNVPYASVVGSIMYAVRCTRPKVAFA